MQYVLVKRKIDGPSVPELGQPVALTFDSIRIPLNRPSTGPNAVAQYELERSTDGNAWTVIATGPAIFGNPPAQFVDGDRVALTTYYYRARTIDTAGRVSAYCAIVSVTTPVNVVPAVMNTRFSSLSWAASTDYSPQGKNYLLAGTDSETGQVFSASSPQIWGSQWGSPHLQLLNDTSQSVPLDTAWTRAFTVDGLALTRNIPYVGVPQAAYRILPNAQFAGQGMVYIRGKFKLPAAMATNVDGSLSLAECKYNFSDSKVQIDLSREGGVWFLRCIAQRAVAGASNLWGTGSTPNRTSAPTQDGFFSSPSGDISIFFKRGVFADDPAGAAPDLTRWYTYEMAFRLASPLGVVSGGAPSGWIWAATTVGTPSAPAANGTGTQRFYVRGSNMFNEPAPGATIIFPFLHYGNLPVQGLPVTWRQVEVYDAWPADASAHPGNAT